ncbi:DUF3871 family protein [Flavobacterium sp.]|uniref:DUF3871 family protein n=1 Tax=Flavobacterium sp. TaxID=239 RepID=UPI00345CA895
MYQRPKKTPENSLFKRKAFVVRTLGLNANKLALTIGGVRTTNQEKLYNKRTYEKFKFLISFQKETLLRL